MANTKFTSLKNFNNVDVSLHNYEVMLAFFICPSIPFHSFRAYPIQ